MSLRSSGLQAAARRDKTTMRDVVHKADPATFEIIKNGLYKIAEEMRVVLAKTAYSPLLKSAGDYSCGIFDVRGEMVAQGPDLPIHLGCERGDDGAHRIGHRAEVDGQVGPLRHHLGSMPDA